MGLQTSSQRTDRLGLGKIMLTAEYGIHRGRGLRDCEGDIVVIMEMDNYRSGYFGCPPQTLYFLQCGVPFIHPDMAQ